MPYSIRKAGDKYKLLKKDTGEEVGTHDSRASAMSQMKAIYANEGKPANKGMMDGMYGDSMMSNPVPIAFISPDDPRANYDPLGGSKSYACANCEFFNARSSSCQLVTGDIVPTGYCDLWTRELSKDEMMADRAMPVYMVEKSFLAKVKETIQDVLGLTPAEPFANFTSGFKTFGDKNQYWVAFWSNNAQDRDGEWFAEKAHDQYVDRVASGVIPYPELWYWHDPRFKSGKAFYIDRIGHCMIAVGEFDDNPVANHMKAYFAKGTDDGVSHGYLYPRSMRVNGVYHDYNTFEISPLPPEVASNPFTTFVSAQEILNMSLNAEQKKALENRLGTDFVNQLYATGEAKSKAMEAVTTNFKSVTDNPLEASVKALDEKFDLLLAAIASSKAFPPKKKTGKEGSAEEEDSESDTEAESEGDKPKKKKEVAPTADPTMIAILQGMDKSIKALAASLAPVVADVKAIKGEFANPISATRSPDTVVPAGDSALLALANQYVNANKGGDPNVAPNAPVDPNQYVADFSTVFGGTQVYQALNGNKP